MKRANIRAIIMFIVIIMAMGSLALAGQAPAIAQHDIDQPAFTVDMDMVSFMDVDLSIPYIVVRPSLTILEQSGEFDNDVIMDHIDTGADGFIANSVFRVSKSPIFMLSSGSRNHNQPGNAGALSSEARKGKRFLLPDT